MLYMFFHRISAFRSFFRWTARLSDRSKYLWRLMLSFYRPSIQTWHKIVHTAHIIFTQYCFMKLPRSKNTGRFPQENTGNQRNVEAVFPPEKFRIFFRRIPVLSGRNLTEVIRKMSEKFPTGILPPRSVDFRCFRAGTGHFFGSFLQIRAVSSSRNDRPGFDPIFLASSPWKSGGCYEGFCRAESSL